MKKIVSVLFAATPPLQRGVVPVLLATLLLGLAPNLVLAADHARKVTKVNAPAASARRSSETAERIGITMIDIPAGNFVMGSCKRIELTAAQIEENKKRVFMGQSEIRAADTNCLVGSMDSDASDSETPQHRVSVRGFQMGKTEVTLGQFKRFIKATGNTQLVDDDFIKYNAHGDDAPVVQVSWHDAQAFINWLNEKEGGGYRLPSESEWEYACRAGSNSKYCGGNNLNAVGWYDDNSSKHQHGVGQKQENAFGLYDMSGNVWEWVQDWHHDSYSGAPTDGSAWDDGGEYRVLRGGSWLDYPLDCRAADRHSLSLAIRDFNIGFRLARTLP